MRDGLLAGFALLLALAAPAAAQSGGNFTLRWSTIDGGGVTVATGGTYQLGGTIGQPDAELLSGGVFTLQGGFWAGAADTPTPTPTRTATRTPTATPTEVEAATATVVAGTFTPTLPTATPTTDTTATPSMTVLATATPTVDTSATPTASVSLTPTVDTTVTPTATATSTATPSPTLPLIAPCVGDCDANGVVAVNELVLGVNIAIGTRAVEDCPAFDPDESGTVLVNELIQGVNNALRGCLRRTV